MKLETSREREGSFLALLDDTTRKDLFAFAQYRLYPDGTSLFCEGVPATGVFVVHQGMVQLAQKKTNGAKKMLNVLQPGDVAGLAAVFNNHPYEAVAMAQCSCAVFYIPADDFRSFLRKHPEASLIAAQQLSSELSLALTGIRSLRAKRPTRSDKDG